MSVGDSILIKRGTTSKAYQMAKQLGIEIAASHKGIGSQMCRVWRTK
jgi:hypothetical protein